jgi:TRAP-type C4-dicarboxylate transport system permease small subunit
VQPIGHIHGAGVRGANARRSVLEKLCRMIAAICLFGMMALTFVSVISRYFFDWPVPGDSELQAFMLGFIIFSSIPLVTRAQRHIAVRAFAALLKGRALFAQRIFVLLGTAAGLGFMGYFIFLQAELLWEENIKSNYLNIPEAPFVYVFACLMAIAVLIALGRLVVLVRSGKTDEDPDEEEIAAEIASTE